MAQNIHVPDRVRTSGLEEAWKTMKERSGTQTGLARLHSAVANDTVLVSVNGETFEMNKLGRRARLELQRQTAKLTRLKDEEEAIEEAEHLLDELCRLAASALHDKVAFLAGDEATLADVLTEDELEELPIAADRFHPDAQPFLAGHVFEALRAHERGVLMAENLLKELRQIEQGEVEDARDFRRDR